MQRPTRSASAVSALPSSCPHCATNAHPVVISEPTQMDYFRCEPCGMIWMRPRGRDGPIYIVAQPLNPKNPPKSPT